MYVYSVYMYVAEENNYTVHGEIHVHMYMYVYIHSIIVKRVTS